MNRLTTRLLRWLDPLFALTLAGALMMVAITAWPGSARAADTTTEARSTGDVKVQADKTLQVNIAGSGDVVYAGNPTVRQSILGSGTVTRR